MIMIVELLLIFLGGGGGKDNGNTSIHPSIHQLFFSALVFLRMQLAASEPNFYSRWRRAAMMMLVDLLLFFMGIGGGKDDRKIHSSIRQLFISTPNF